MQESMSAQCESTAASALFHPAAPQHAVHSDGARWHCYERIYTFILFFISKAILTVLIFMLISSFICYSYS